MGWWGVVLQNYLDTTDPPMLRRTVVKLANTGKRLKAVNSWFAIQVRRRSMLMDGVDSLSTLQTRINKIYLQLSKQRIPASGS